MRWGESKALPKSMKGQGIPGFCGCTITDSFCQKKKKVGSVFSLLTVDNSGTGYSRNK